ncbi:MAG: restriction endonuclease subunit S [candidate division NC10 bacterium]|nr:restriction endonuclease subunit S [candidate division NC10 bacterium]MDE2321025.1 restriction endonuclease subunit S [candidate division NC10 bacterium]
MARTKTPEGRHSGPPTPANAGAAWRSARFEDICSRVQDSASPTSTGKRLYLGLEHLASGQPSLIGRGSESEVKSSKTIFRSGDVLFGKLRPYLRKSVIVREDGICSTDILVFRATEKCIPEFICLLTHTDEFVGHAIATTSGVQHPRTSWSGLREFELYVPPIPEQQKIAAMLGVVQRAIEQQERLLALTTELKKTLLHQLFTQGLHGEPQKQTDVGPVPESWEERALEQAGDVIYGIQAAVAANLKPIGTKILTNKNITLDGTITLDSINYFVLKTKRHHETVLKKGDLLFNWRSGSKEHIGKTAYFDLNGEFTHSSFILRVRPNDEVTGRYLFYYLNFLRESGYFKKTQTFSVNAKFNKSAINRLPTYLPGKDERRDIVTALDAVAKKIDMLLVKKHLLEDLFRTMLHQLMTAQIRVHALDLPELKWFLAENAR